MTLGTVIECSRKADRHSSSLRRVSGEWVCQECWAKEQGIEVKKSKGRRTVCPECGKVLMTRFRGNKISFNSMNMKGNTVTLICDCGYRKVIPNPFGGEQNRDRVAFARLKGRSMEKEGINGSERNQE